MYDDLLDKIDFEELEKEDEEYIEISRLLDNKHDPEELIKETEETTEEQDEYELESLADIIESVDKQISE